MIDEKLLQKLYSMELQDVFATLKVFYKKALNFEGKSLRKETGSEASKIRNHPCYKFIDNFLACPECGGETEIDTVCSKSPFHKQGFKTVVICKNE